MRDGRIRKLHLIVGNQFDGVMQRVCSWSCDLVKCDGGVQSVELQSHDGPIQKPQLIVDDVALLCKAENLKSVARFG